MSTIQQRTAPTEPTIEDLFETAPCGHVSTTLDGTITRVNRTFESWTGLTRQQLVGNTRFQELLSPGGRTYHETHYAPLLAMQGAIGETAVEIVRADGSRLPAMINSVVHHDATGAPVAIATVVFDATDRRRYEREMLRVSQREHTVAHRLQQSLLTGTLPDGPDLEIATAYRPGAEHLEVGGDWYDAFWLTEPRTLALVVGDVVGKGVDAAAAMSQLRSAVRALALTGGGPSQVLEALDSYVQRYGVGRLATVVYAEVDLTRCELRYACAGHPPPVLIEPDGPVSLLWEGRSPPLAVDLNTFAPRAEAAQIIEPGSGLVLYTDGLASRRSHPGENGLERLRGMIAGHRDSPVASMAPTILRELRDDEHPDDACILAARLGTSQSGTGRQVMTARR
jgi:phosphoserine phosphatase RsbU/P